MAKYTLIEAGKELTDKLFDKLYEACEKDGFPVWEGVDASSVALGMDDKPITEYVLARHESPRILHNGQMYVQRILVINNPLRTDFVPTVFDEDWYLFEWEVEEMELPFE